jgi:hypothetical protein
MELWTAVFLAAASSAVMASTLSPGTLCYLRHDGIRPACPGHLSAVRARNAGSKRPVRWLRQNWVPAASPKHDESQQRPCSVRN